MFASFLDCVKCYTFVSRCLLLVSVTLCYFIHFSRSSDDNNNTELHLAGMFARIFKQIYLSLGMLGDNRLISIHIKTAHILRKQKQLLHCRQLHGRSTFSCFIRNKCAIIASGGLTKIRTQRQIQEHAASGDSTYRSSGYLVEQQVRCVFSKTARHPDMIYPQKTTTSKRQIHFTLRFAVHKYGHKATVHSFVPRFLSFVASTFALKLNA